MIERVHTTSSPELDEKRQGIKHTLPSICDSLSENAASNLGLNEHDLGVPQITRFSCSAAFHGWLEWCRDSGQSDPNHIADSRSR